MNAETALRETILLWNALALSPGARKQEIPGPWRMYLFMCPCCEYAQIGNGCGACCEICPMFEQWFYFDRLRNDEQFITGLSPCCLFHSPYRRWLDELDLFEAGHKSFSMYDLEFFCLLMVELAEEALKELLENRGMVE